MAYTGGKYIDVNGNIIDVKNDVLSSVIPDKGINIVTNPETGETTFSVDPSVFTGDPAFKGDPGKDGKDGKDGEPGKDGLDGEKGEKGEKGDKGDKGDSVEMIKTPTGCILSVGATSCEITNGLNGKDGEQGKDGTNGTDGETPSILITENEDKTAAIVTFKFTDESKNTSFTVPYGNDGENGKDGISITEVVPPETYNYESGASNEMTVKYSNGESSTFEVFNGAQGQAPEIAPYENPVGSKFGNGISFFGGDSTLGVISVYRDDAAGTTDLYVRTGSGLGSENKVTIKDGVQDPMVFKGTFANDSEWAAATETAKPGYTYIATANIETTVGGEKIKAEQGDTIIFKDGDDSWVVIPSGDDPGPVASFEITYASSDSLTIPTEWKNNISEVSFIAEGYVWSKTEVTYKDGTVTTTYNVSKNGANGVNTKVEAIEDGIKFIDGNLNYETLTLKEVPGSTIPGQFAGGIELHAGGKTVSIPGGINGSNVTVSETASGISISDSEGNKTEITITEPTHSTTPGQSAGNATLSVGGKSVTIPGGVNGTNGNNATVTAEENKITITGGDGVSSTVISATQLSEEGRGTGVTLEVGSGSLTIQGGADGADGIGVTVEGSENKITFTGATGSESITLQAYSPTESEVGGVQISIADTTLKIKNGEKGDAFKYEDFTPEQLASLKGDKGDAFKYSDFTPEQLEGLKGEKGDKGDAFKYSDFTPEQLEGLTGPQGIQGKQGEQGIQGIQGPQGDKGEKGDAFKYSDFTEEQLEALRGPQGETGPQGEQGIQGIQGETGPKGDKGDKGDTGAQGPKGETGEKGDTGPQGPKGETGETGPQGIQGIQGEKGDTGSQGPKGDAFKYEDFTEEQLESLRGPQGIKGDTGSQGPKGETGEKGDTGPQGPQGEKGDTGAQGEKGDKGDTGAKGDKGDTGPQGDKGDKGEQGEQGIQGPQGEPGVNTSITSKNGTITFTGGDGKTSSIAFETKAGATGYQDGIKITVDDNEFTVNGAKNGIDGIDGIDGSNVTISNITDGIRITDEKAGVADITITSSTSGDWHIFTVGNKNVKITNGVDGKDGANGKDGTDGKDGENGEDGNGISKIETVKATAGQAGELKITYTNESSETVSVPCGPAGEDGNSITGIIASKTTAGENGELTISYSKADDEKVVVPCGPQGPDGVTPELKSTPGTDGKSTDLNFTYEGKSDLDKTVNIPWGTDGVSVTGITPPKNPDTSSKAENEMTVHYSNNTTSTFSVWNGERGPAPLIEDYVDVAANSKYGKGFKFTGDEGSVGYISVYHDDANGTTDLYVRTATGEDNKVTIKDGIQDPMVFKGSVTSSADWVSKETDAKAGYTYIVVSTETIENGDLTASKGDTLVFVDSTTKWAVIPSGDDKEFVTKLTEGNGIKITHEEDDETSFIISNNGENIIDEDGERNWIVGNNNTVSGCYDASVYGANNEVTDKSEKTTYFNNFGNLIGGKDNKVEFDADHGGNVVVGSRNEIKMHYAEGSIVLGNSNKADEMEYNTCIIGSYNEQLTKNENDSTPPSYMLFFGFGNKNTDHYGWKNSVIGNYNKLLPQTEGKIDTYHSNYNNYIYGDNNEMTGGNRSVIIGLDNKLFGYGSSGGGSSFIVGLYNTVTSKSSAAAYVLGNNNRIEKYGDYDSSGLVAVGNSNLLKGEYDYVFGSSNAITGTYTTAVGSSLKLNDNTNSSSDENIRFDRIIMGTQNAETDEDKVFILGAGVRVYNKTKQNWDYEPRNAFEIDKNCVIKYYYQGNMVNLEPASSSIAVVSDEDITSIVDALD